LACDEFAGDVDEEGDGAAESGVEEADVSGRGFREAAEVKEADDVEGDEEREGCIVDGLHSDGRPSEADDEEEHDGRIEGNVERD